MGVRIAWRGGAKDERPHAVRKELLPKPASQQTWTDAIPLSSRQAAMMGFSWTLRWLWGVPQV